MPRGSILRVLGSVWASFWLPFEGLPGTLLEVFLCPWGGLDRFLRFWEQNGRKLGARTDLKQQQLFIAFLIDVLSIWAPFWDYLFVVLTPKNRIRAPSWPFGPHLGHVVPIWGSCWQLFGTCLGMLPPFWDHFLVIVSKIVVRTWLYQIPVARAALIPPPCFA